MVDTEDRILCIYTPSVFQKIMSKFKNQFRVDTTRLKDWDYSATGWYFVTICTKGNVSCFGEIMDGKMQLSQAGKIVAEEWVRTGEVRSNVVLDRWIIMPNHMHAILSLKEFEASQNDEAADAFMLKANSLGSIINQFKGGCTKRIRKSGMSEFSWQPNYYDHIIRNERSLRKIREYIQENPMKWELDEYYSARY